MPRAGSVTPVDADTARTLIADGLDLLAGLPPYDEGEALALGTRLRTQGYDAGLVAAVLSQSRLRERARAKFGADAARLLFTADGLEQATRREVADRHAQRFAAAGIETVHDLGCGIGSDALALGRAGLTVRAVDADEATALLADHNIGALGPDAFGQGRSRARQGRAEDARPSPTEGVWFDPARRTPGRNDASGRTRRTLRLQDMAPSWEFVQDSAARIPATGAKLSPAFPHPAIPADTEAEWVSTGGDLVECALWWGPLAQTPGRVATVVRRSGEVVTVTEADAVGAAPAGTSVVEPGSLLYEPDLAVLQAGLVGALSDAVEGAELGEGAGYVVSEERIDVPYARRHRVTDVLPAQVKAVKAWLRREGVTGLTIKRRGGRLDPEEFRRRLGLSARGGDQATLLLTVGPDGPLALVLDREA
ncbi:hypothetical protein GCM10025883_05220 [Mobilicoccus caccae]|uniref:THUMP-like domain-containing protein n=1 Tax=Mobilicoccus caccae TaxID=1859295 RepID=A0ABQ6IMR9_9MICO|nr:hypothetical protein GCM10025883_05220 [Mobilicoccus caccae]